MSVFRYIGIFFGVTWSLDVFAVPCAPVPTQNTNSQGVSVVVAGNSSVAVTDAGSAEEPCGMKIDMTASSTVNTVKVSSMMAQVASGNVVGNMGVSISASGKGTNRANSIWMVGDTPNQSRYVASASTIVGNSAVGMVSSGLRIQTDPPPGVPPKYIYDMAGATYANSIMSDVTDMAATNIIKVGNSAANLTAVGGTSMANSDNFSVDRSGAKSGAKNSVLLTSINEVGDVATQLTSFGLKVGDGESAIGDKGVARANSFTISNTDTKLLSVNRVANQASNLTGVYGSSIANGADFTEHRGMNGAVSINFLSNSAGNISAVGIPMRPNKLPKTSVLANHVKVDKGQLNGANSYVLLSNSVNNASAMLGGNVKANAVNLAETNQTATNNVLLGNSVQNPMSVAYSVSDSGEFVGSSVTANGISHSKNSSNLAGSSILMGNQSQNAIAISGGKVTENSVSNGKNAQLVATTQLLNANSAQSNIAIGKNSSVTSNGFSNSDGGNVVATTAAIMGNQAQSSIAVGEGKVGSNRLSNGEKSTMVGTVGTLMQNTSTAAMAMGKDSSVNENSLNNGDQANMIGVVGMLMGNQSQGSIAMGGGKVGVNRVSNSKSSTLTGASMMLMQNNSVSATAMGKDSSVNVNSFANSGTATGVNFMNFGNTSSAALAVGGGSVLVNSFQNGSTGNVSGSNLMIGGNSSFMSLAVGKQAKSIVNGVSNKGALTGNVVIMGNTATSMATSGDAVVNSFSNSQSGRALGSVNIVGNTGIVMMGGEANSVVNKGTLIGNVMIAGNRGVAISGGTSTSLVNEGTVAGSVVIVGSNGVAVGKNVYASSVINRSAGVIAGSAMIVGTTGAAVSGRTHGSVLVNAGVAAGVGVAGNVAFGGNPEWVPNPVISQSIEVTGTPRAWMY